MKKLINDNKGFSLTEVMIGMMILAVAIVAVSNLLITVIGANRESVADLQAYYLAEEGIEAVRNIRDSNWLHGKDWLGADSFELWGGGLKEEIQLSLLENGWSLSPFSASAVGTDRFMELAGYLPWNIQNVDESTDLSEVYWVNGENSGYKRVLTIEPYLENGCNLDECIVVTSTVKGKFSEEITLKTVLTDWKKGLL